MNTNILPELDNKQYINDLKDQYDILFCEKSEGDNLIEFIKNHWAKDHIFVKSRELFDWQHYDEENKRYNFVIAKEKKTQEIHSVLGFIPLYHPGEEGTCDVWPCIWKVREDIKVKGLGVSLYKYLKDNLRIRAICVLGISEIALSIYKKWNFKTGHIKQYYLTNPIEEKFKLIVGTEKEKMSEFIIGKELVLINEEKFIRLNTIDFNKSKEIPFKDKNYYIHRFFKHPIYKYKAYGVKIKDKIESVVFVRVIEQDNKKCIRIVDFYGEIETLYNMKGNFQKILIDNEAEYIDFINVGYAEEHFIKIGFTKKESSKGIIVPNYFEPFMLKNIELEYAWKSISDNEDKAVFFKADSDQDRPNII